MFIFPFKHHGKMTKIFLLFIDEFVNVGILGKQVLRSAKPFHPKNIVCPRTSIFKNK